MKKMARSMALETRSHVLELLGAASGVYLLLWLGNGELSGLVFAGVS